MRTATEIYRDKSVPLMLRLIELEAQLALVNNNAAADLVGEVRTALSAARQEVSRASYHCD